MPTVFISSTSEDLKDCRTAARDAAMRAGFEVVMMEYFVASGDKPPLAKCLQLVSRTDVVVAIVAHRYGWKPPDQPGGLRKSITWLECERAIEEGKEVLAFLVDPKAPWSAELRENYRLTEATASANPMELFQDVQESIANLAEFKQWIDVRAPRETFTTCPDIAQALNDWCFRHPDKCAGKWKPGDDPGKYLRWLRDQTAWIDIRGLQVGSEKAHQFPIRELYIPLTTAAGGEREARMEQRRSVDLDTALRHRRLVIVGDPGAGKTTFLRRIAFEMVEGYSQLRTPQSIFDRILSFFREAIAGPEAAPPLPVFIRVSELARHVRDSNDGPTDPEAPRWIPHFLAQRCRDHVLGLDEEYFRRRFDAGEAMILLDGLDEAPNDQARAHMSALFSNATRSWNRCQFVVTTRPAAYTGHAILSGFEHTRIEPLQPDAIAAFLTRWCGFLYPGSVEESKRHLEVLLAALQQNQSIRGMAGNPVMLTALAVLHWNDNRLPQQRAELYESILVWLARSRESKPGRETWESFLQLLQNLALGMQKYPNGRKTQISKGEAADILAPQFRDAEPDQRRQRASVFLLEEEIDSGVIVSRDTDVRFWHLTFQEHLAARKIADLAEVDQKTLLMADRCIYLPEWREVALLLAGILRTKQGPGKVDVLVKMLLDSAEGKSLAERARCVGLIGGMVRDLSPLGYSPSDPRYKDMLDSVVGIFEPGAETIDFQVRLEAAEALGQAGDPRFEKENWVRIGDFEIGKYPVTVQEYAKFVESEAFGDRRLPDAWDEQLAHPTRPVVSVSWFDAEAYCEWGGWRLPTEAEWKLAARGREKREYPWGKEPPDATLANYGRTVGHPTPIGMYPRGATPEGLMDMAGNVWQWSADWYDDEQKFKALRGGSWSGDAEYLRASYRLRYPPDYRYSYMGFRCTREVIP